jgi:hypothetical protein
MSRVHWEELEAIEEPTDEEALKAIADVEGYLDLLELHFKKEQAKAIQLDRLLMEALGLIGRMKFVDSETFAEYNRIGLERQKIHE